MAALSDVPSRVFTYEPARQFPIFAQNQRILLLHATPLGARSPKEPYGMEDTAEITPMGDALLISPGVRVCRVYVCRLTEPLLYS